MIVKQFCSKKPPPITTGSGTRYRKEVLDEHLKSSFHNECMKAARIDSTKTIDKAPTDKAINKAHKQMLDYVGKLCIKIYNDANGLNLSAWSWPSRYVAAEVSHSFDSSVTPTKCIILSNSKLQYVNPKGHLELMSAIVSSFRNDFLAKIKNCIAISLRADGSVDMTQIDKIYVLGKIINADGYLELVFLGVANQNKRHASGLMDAVNDALQDTFGDPKIVYEKVSSICTDGTNINTGDKKSL